MAVIFLSYPYIARKKGKCYTSGHILLQHKGEVLTDWMRTCCGTIEIVLAVRGSAQLHQEVARDHTTDATLDVTVVTHS
jgi:hypothetical protein